MLPRLPSVRDIIKIYGLSARSQLGQNFILDKNITDKIVRSAQLSDKTPLVVEVGPGPGLLTRSILDTPVDRVVAVEKDTRFLPTLKQLSEATSGRLRIIQGNMLEIPHQDIWEAAERSPSQVSSTSPCHLMGNLPFNVASPLLVQWLHMAAQRKGLFESGNVWMTLMFQKEVAERLYAKPSTSQRGRLAVMAQALCHVRNVYTIPSTVFVPMPKVDAAVVQLTPRLSPTEHNNIQDVYPVLENLLRYCFTKRRKTMGHILRRLAKEVPESEAILPDLEHTLDFGARPEDIDTEQFVRAAELLAANKIVLP